MTLSYTGFLADVRAGQETVTGDQVRAIARAAAA
jgi:hypothetical protein